VELKGVTRCRNPGDIHLRFHLAPRGGIPWQPAPFTPKKLILTVFSAAGLPQMDTFGKCDPYVVIELKGQGNPQKTAVKKQTFTPTWDERFELFLTSAQEDVLSLVMWDEDPIIDEKMATLELPVARFLGNELTDEWYEMIPAPRVPKGVQLRLRVKVVPLERSSRLLDFLKQDTGLERKCTAARWFADDF
jgi:hypothetical protein